MKWIGATSVAAAITKNKSTISKIQFVGQDNVGYFKDMGKMVWKG